MTQLTLSRQTYAIAALCLIDLTTTLWLVTDQGALEANPLMRRFLAQGLFGFAAAKIAMTILPLAFMEWARRRRPVMVQRALSLTAVAYVSLYALGVVHVNVAYANGGGKNDRYEASCVDFSQPNGSPEHSRHGTAPVPFSSGPKSSAGSADTAGSTSSAVPWAGITAAR